MPKLKRSLGLFECTLMGIGVMLGAGIYALVGEAAALAGNLVWLSFLGASIVAAMTGLSYAELSSFIPKAGGEYYYARRAFGSRVAFLVSWLLLVGVAICSAAVATGFSGYLNAMTGFHEIWGAVLLIVAMSALLVYGIRQSAWVAVTCTVVELIGLAIIIAVGLPKIGSIDYLEPAAGGAVGVLSAAALIFFAYIGFEEIVQLSEETRDAPKAIPRALLVSIVVTTILYVTVAVCAISVLGWERLGASKSPLADVAAFALGQRAFFVLSVIALFSTANTVLILLMSAARLLYGMAEDGTMPRVFAGIHGKFQTPHLATSAVAALALVLIVSLRKLAVIANLTNFSLLATFVIINSAVVVLRFREPDAPRPFRIPGRIGKVPIIPCLGVISSLAMLLFVGRMAMVVGTALLLCGVGIFLICRERTPNLDDEP